MVVNPNFVAIDLDGDIVSKSVERSVLARSLSFRQDCRLEVSNGQSRAVSSVTQAHRFPHHHTPSPRFISHGYTQFLSFPPFGLLTGQVILQNRILTINLIEALTIWNFPHHPPQSELLQNFFLAFSHVFSILHSPGLHLCQTIPSPENSFSLPRPLLADDNSSRFPRLFEHAIHIAGFA